MYKRRTINMALTAATIAVAVALPVGTASAATARPQVNTEVFEANFTDLGNCNQNGRNIVNYDGADSWSCVYHDDSKGAYWSLYSIWS